jgi:hypothetical protein
MEWLIRLTKILRRFEMDRQYFVWIEDEDPIIVTVKDDVNRPNNPDCDSVLHEWMTDNYGSKKFGYYELDSCEKVQI